MTNGVNICDFYLWAEHTHTGCTGIGGGETGIVIWTLDRLLQFVPEVE